MSDQTRVAGAHVQAAFPTTHWSQVLVAGEGGESPRAAEALAALCSRYWYPVYAYVRRAGHDPHNAQDLTQEFFARLIEKNFVAGASQGKGRFRSFLLVALKRFLVNEWERSRAQKRGGGRPLLSLDAEEAEARYRLEPADQTTPDRIYERRWALALLEEVMNTLRREYTADGKGELFELLQVFLYGDKSVLSQAEIGARFGLSESAVKSAVHRLRGRYRERLREEVAQTVVSPVDVEDELRHLLNVLSG
jgi:RNA polymerase sigma-70 factor (ECF subfamily)